MKKKSVIVLVILLIVSACRTEDFFVEPDPVEAPELKTTIGIVQKAFENSDTAKIRELILPSYFSMYKTALQSNSGKLSDFGKLLKNMEMVHGDSAYMVYKVNYDKRQFEVSFCRDEKGKWKIMNF